MVQKRQTDYSAISSSRLPIVWSAVVVVSSLPCHIWFPRQLHVAIVAAPPQKDMRKRQKDSRATTYYLYRCKKHLTHFHNDRARLSLCPTATYSNATTSFTSDKVQIRHKTASSTRQPRNLQPNAVYRRQSCLEANR